MTDKIDDQTEDQDVNSRGGSLETKGALRVEQPTATGAESRTGGNTQTKSGSKIASPDSETHTGPTSAGSGEESEHRKS